MKRLFLLAALLFGQSLFAFEPTKEQWREIRDAIVHNKDREQTYRFVSGLLNRGLNPNAIFEHYTLLLLYAEAKFYKTQYNHNIEPHEFHWSEWDEKLIREIVAKGADINLAVTALGTTDTPLILAVRRDHIELVRLYVDLGANVNFKGHRIGAARDSAFYRAIFSQEITEILLPKLNRTDEDMICGGILFAYAKASSFPWGASYIKWLEEHEFPGRQYCNCLLNGMTVTPFDSCRDYGFDFD